MEYEERICREQGNYIVASDRSFENILDKTSIVLKSGVINPGQFTTLHNWFIKPVEFLGFIENKKAIFYLGAGTNDLINNGGFYYDLTIILQPDRIGKSYKAGSFRDVYLRQSKNGDFFWK